MVNVASLDPADFRHVAAEPAVGQIQISQVSHGLQVRNITELHVPCACGRPLCGVDHEWIHDSKGSALFVKGVCLTCGNQEALYLSEPAVSLEDGAARRQERLLTDIARLVQQVSELPGNEIEEEKEKAA